MGTMSEPKTRQSILRQVLDLSPIERVELVEKVLRSFDFPERNDIDAAWGKETEDRVDAYERGEMASFPASEVFDEIEALGSSR